MQEINSLKDFFTSAHALLLEGQMVNMNGIDKRISVVCQTAQNAPPEQQKAYLPELTTLISLLNSYEAGLRKMQTSLAAEVTKGVGDGDPD